MSIAYDLQQALPRELRIFPDSAYVPQYPNYVGGRWYRSDSALDVYTPIDGSLIATVPRGDKEFLETAAHAAYDARESAREFPGYRMILVLDSAAKLLRQYRDAFEHALVVDAGKCEASARSEVTATIERFEKAGLMDMYRLQRRKVISGDMGNETKGTGALVTREPYGVVLAITPFNYPLYAAAAKIAPALLGGNTVILKPSSYAPLAALMLTRVLELAGLPPGSLTTITAPGSDAHYFVGSNRVGMISFTGSTETGEEIVRTAGIKPLQLELGGMDSALVLSDADLDRAAAEVAKGAFNLSGQRCCALRTGLVEDSVYEQFTNRLLQEGGKYILGDPRDPASVMGPLISKRAVEKVDELVQDAVRRGARIVTGGRYRDQYYEPTVLHANDDCRILREEAFGPVISLVRVKDLDDAIERANASPYGLDATVFTKDPIKQTTAAKALDVGAVYMNRSPKHGIGLFPYGGRRGSGRGREGLQSTIQEMTAEKTIVFDDDDAAIWGVEELLKLRRSDLFEVTLPRDLPFMINYDNQD